MLQANPGTVALVDLELLAEPDGPSLQVQLAARRDPTVLINARGAVVPESLSLKRTVFVLSSRNQGALDIGHIQDNLLAAIHAVRVTKAQDSTNSGTLWPPPPCPRLRPKQARPHRRPHRNVAPRSSLSSAFPPAGRPFW